MKSARHPRGAHRLLLPVASDRSLAALLMGAVFPPSLCLYLQGAGCRGSARRLGASGVRREAPRNPASRTAV
ncbi:hypothetical protein NDU88_003750 [Pleurodeles waltl]|uniref:Uncharacterized protein n=1 Tax=Pleurodeles waltl TaxID=8319 RepID=A0AAV7QAK8_PLEWA|nr:hypothetical protein NDU88_003750 [Pleurodeles waltl]